MHISDVLHDLIHHSPAWPSEHNREEAHQAVDDEFGCHGGDAPETETPPAPAAPSGEPQAA